jgi:hypothetical protein
MQLRGGPNYGEVVSSLVPIFERLALRNGSKRTYADLLRHYDRFCSDTGRDPRARISETRLCEAAIYFCSQRTVRSLGNYASALQWWHTVSGFGPLPRDGLYHRVTKGLRNVYGQFDKSEPACRQPQSDLFLCVIHRPSVVRRSSQLVRHALRILWSPSGWRIHSKVRFRCPPSRQTRHAGTLRCPAHRSVLENIPPPSRGPDLQSLRPSLPVDRCEALPFFLPPAPRRGRTILRHLTRRTLRHTHTRFIHRLAQSQRSSSWDT